MVKKSVFKIAFLLSRKRLKSELNALFLGIFILILIFICLKDSFSSSMQIFINLFPYLFLILSRDLLHDDIQNGALENLLFIAGKYKSFLFWKVVSTILLVFILVTSIFILYILLSCLEATFSVTLVYTYFSGVIVGIYLALVGSFLSFYVKGSANILLVLIFQMFCVFLPIILGVDKLHWFFNMIENGVPSIISQQMEFSIILIVLPNLIMRNRFIGFVPVVFIFIIVLSVVHVLKIKSLEITKK